MSSEAILLSVLAAAGTATSRWQSGAAPTCHHSPTPADADPGERGVVLLAWRGGMVTCPLCTHVRYASPRTLSHCGGCDTDCAPGTGKVHLVELAVFLDPDRTTGPAGDAARYAVVLCPDCSPEDEPLESA